MASDDRFVPLTSHSCSLIGTVLPAFFVSAASYSGQIANGNERLLFDCGRGATLRLTQMGVPIGSIHRLFLTHLHSDQGHSVVLSGDTRVSENLIRFARGTDVLVHETLDAETVRTWFPGDPRVAAGILAKHTTPEQAGEVFARVKPGLAVYSHAPNAQRVIAQTRKTYAGHFREQKTCW
jgi:ribonuclease BN (tRNA processing enzyme)